MRMRFLLIIVMFLSIGLDAQKFAFQLPFEVSNGIKTSTYAQTIKFCKAVDSFSDIVTFTTFGKSAGGYDLPLLIIDKDGHNSPEQIKNTNKLVLLVEANIHAGEPDGNDAGMLLIKDFLNNKKLDLLNHITFLFIPTFNADGVNRVSAFNRINQNGPEKMGWRTNSNNLNLNRDFLKADSPEIQAWLSLFNKWDPDFFIDCHTTDGADYQYAITYGLEIYGNMEQDITNWQVQSLLPFIEQGMKAKNMPIFPYVAFRNWHDPRSGLIVKPARPMLSEGYTALRNRPGLLIETHMLKPFKTRVLATRQLIEYVMQKLNEDHINLRKIIKNDDQFVISQKFMHSKFALDYENTKEFDEIDFLGIDYDISKSDLTGGNWYQYHTGHKKTFHLKYFNHSKPKSSVFLPKAYIIPQQWKNIANRLKIHGVRIEKIPSDTIIIVEKYKFSNVKLANNSFEGHQLVKNFDITIFKDTVLVHKNDYCVRTEQYLVKVIAYALEPQSPDSYLQWGFLNSIFEQKEYAETYVMEKIAREMIKANPNLKVEFNNYVKQNPTVKSNQWLQLNWFYQKSPYWDGRKDIYPIMRVLW